MIATIAFTLPGMRLVNPCNDHTHWRNRQRRALAQRRAMRIALSRFASEIEALKATGRVRVVITRFTQSRGLDSDSLPASGKHVRDGVAEVFGIDDGNENFWVWEVRQVWARGFACRVEIESAAIAAELPQAG